MRMRISSKFKLPVEKAWLHLQNPKLMEFICKPIQHFKCLSPKSFPKKWKNGDFSVRMFSFGIDIGEHHLKIEIPKQKKNRQEFSIRDNGYGNLVKKWDHWVYLREMKNGNTLYTDQVDINAGIFTPIVWIYSVILYFWRQRRWKYLIRNNFREIKKSR